MNYPYHIKEFVSPRWGYDDVFDLMFYKRLIPTGSNYNPSEKKMHDNLVTLVDRMLELNKQLQKTNFDSEREPIERQIKSTDKKIDALVYELYGLTEDEIKIVEGGR